MLRQRWIARALACIHPHLRCRRLWDLEPICRIVRGLHDLSFESRSCVVFSARGCGTGTAKLSGPAVGQVGMTRYRNCRIGALLGPPCKACSKVEVDGSSEVCERVSTACRLGVSEGTSPCVETPIRFVVASSAIIVSSHFSLSIGTTRSSFKMVSRNPLRESQLRLADAGGTEAATLSSATSDQ